MKHATKSARTSNWDRFMGTAPVARGSADTVLASDQPGGLVSRPVAPPARTSNWDMSATWS